MGDSFTIDALVFDLDDTLYPERSHAVASLRAVADRFASELGPADRLHERFCELMDSEHRRRVFDIVLDELGRDDADVLVPRMIETYRYHRPRLTLYPDAADALGRWSDRVPLGLITDGRVDLQQHKIDILGIADRFAAVVITGQWGEAFFKPNPRAFEEMNRQLGVSGNRCAYVGDNLGKDFLAPRRLGWRTIHIDRRDGLYAGVSSPNGGEPDVTITSLDELDSALEP
jgi:putative hydrolase of the HAD superfamily